MEISMLQVPLSFRLRYLWRKKTLGGRAANVVYALHGDCKVLEHNA